MQKTVVLNRLLYLYQETAQVLGVHPNTVRNYIDEGKLERISICKSAPRVTVESIAKYLQSKGVKVEVDLEKRRSRYLVELPS
jgi:predicted site-specific integrase-resolvase